jgi:hypothetical protein
MNTKFVNVVNFIKNDFIEATVDSRFNEAISNSKDVSLFNNRPPRFVTFYSRNDADNTNYEWLDNISKNNTNIVIMKINGNDIKTVDNNYIEILNTLIDNINDSDLLDGILNSFNDVIGKKYNLSDKAKISVMPLFEVTDSIMQIIIDTEFK